MSGYIGTQPVPQSTQTRDSFTATSGQTSFATGGYQSGYIDLYLNGIKLAAADYTATNNSDVVLAVGATAGDILEVVAYTAFNTANVTGAVDFTVTNNIVVGGTVDGVDIATRDAVLTSTTTTADAALPRSGGTMTGDLTLDSSTHAFLKLDKGASGDYALTRYYTAGTEGWRTGTYNDGTSYVIGTPTEKRLSITTSGNVDITGTASVDGDLTISNRIFHAGDTDTYFQFETANTARFVIGGAENVRYNTTGTVFNEDSNNLDFRVESNGNVNMLFVDGGNDTVAIGTSDTNFDPVADNLIVGTGSGSNGITIYTGGSAGNKGSIFFADTAAGDATNSRKGQISYEQNNEIMTFFTADTKAMEIGFIGAVNMPLQPAFSQMGNKSHTITTTGTPTMTSANVWSTGVVNSLNRGSHFSASTGKFTAPVAGVYQFSFDCMASNLNSGYLYFYFKQNTTTLATMQKSQGNIFQAISFNANISLAANDYVSVCWTNNYASGIIHWPCFSGSLLG